MKDYGVTCLRITLGLIYVVQAYLALFVATPQGMAGFLANKAGLPWPTVLALAVVAIHLGGGGMLVLGVWTRVAAAANLLVLLVGVGATYLHQGLVLRSAVVDAAAGRHAGPGYEYLVLLLAATVAVASVGPGAWSLGK